MGQFECPRMQGQEPGTGSSSPTNIFQRMPASHLKALGLYNFCPIDCQMQQIFKAREKLGQLVSNIRICQKLDASEEICQVFAVYKIQLALQYESEKVGKISEQNGLKGLQLVQFECPRH